MGYIDSDKTNPAH